MNYQAAAVLTLVDFMLRHARPLFHVTDECHLPSIAQNGLLSVSELNARGIVPPYPGGTDKTRAFDEDYGLSDYVFLGFTSSGLMPANREKSRSPRLLYIDPRVLLFRGVKLALGRDSRARWKVRGIGHALHAIDEKTLTIFRRLLEGECNWRDVGIHDKWRVKHVMDFEVLIPKQIPTESIVVA